MQITLHFHSFQSLSSDLGGYGFKVYRYGTIALTAGVFSIDVSSDFTSIEFVTGCIANVSSRYIITSVNRNGTKIEGLAFRRDGITTGDTTTNGPAACFLVYGSLK